MVAIHFPYSAKSMSQHPSFPETIAPSVKSELGKILQKTMEDRAFYSGSLPASLLHQDRDGKNLVWKNASAKILASLAHTKREDVAQKFPHQKQYLSHHFPEAWEKIEHRVKEICAEEKGSRPSPKKVLDALIGEMHVTVDDYKKNIARTLEFQKTIPSGKEQIRHAKLYFTGAHKGAALY